MAEGDLRPSEEHVRRSRKLVEVLVPALREVARRNGYALALHGSLERDIDIIAVPWREGAVGPLGLVEDLHAACKVVIGCATWQGGSEEMPEPERKPHGRMAWAIILSGGPYLDVSVMPRDER